MFQKTFGFPQIISRTLRKTKISQENKSINENLGILLRTRPGEMLGDPNYGCSLIDRLFRYQGLVVNDLIIEDIIDAVNKYEPRIIMTKNDISLVPDGNVIRIYLTYTIKETGEVNDYNMEISSNENPYR